MQTVIELSSELSMAQDTTISQRFLDQLVVPLIHCLDMTPFPDIISKPLHHQSTCLVYATICLTHIMDIVPPLCNKVASQGGVGLLCKRLESVESFELLENVIRALEKIATEIPYAILTANGLVSLARLLDFFEYPQQVTFF